MSSNIAIKVENLTKSYQIYDKPSDRLKQMLIGGRKQYYREFKAVQDVSFEIKKGETVGIIGRNGSGKSTLLQLICGTLNPTNGNIQTNGRIAALLELGSGFNPEFTGRENVYMNAAILGLSNSEINNKFDDIVAFADIGEFIEQPVKTYSSGMMMRLAFAVAINVDPLILIIDEALAVGDELFQRKCFSRIEAIKKNGATILFVSHSGGSILELCDHAFLIDAGEKLAMGTPKVILSSYQKLLYAPEEKKQDIRKSIRMSTEGEALQKNTVNPSIDSGSLCEKFNSDDDPAELYEPNLKSKSTVFFESNGAFISAPEIVTLTGRKVNNLRSGRTYEYIYNVEFKKDVYDVRFGMMIKSITGIELGGMSTSSQGFGLEKVKAGDTVNVKFEFNCTLIPGVYFCNAGCRGEVDGEDKTLHRMVDALMFRVLPTQHGVIRTGYVNFAANDPVCEIREEKL